MAPTKTPRAEPFQRNDDGSHRRHWPGPLRAIFWLSVSGLFIGAGQLFFFVVVREDLGPPPTLQGTYAVVAYAANLVIVFAGLRGRRRPFVLATLATALLTSFVTVHFLTETLSGWSDAPAREVVRELPYVAWNLAVVVTAVVIVVHLVSTHVVVTGERPADRPSPLPPPVEVDTSRRD